MQIYDDFEGFPRKVVRYLGWCHIMTPDTVKDTQKQDNNDGNLRGPHPPKQINKALLRYYSGTMMVNKPLTGPAISRGV